jgi:hypothetical protein
MLPDLDVQYINFNWSGSTCFDAAPFLNFSNNLS